MTMTGARFKRSLFWGALGAVLVLALLAVAALGLARAQAAPPQPFPFPHAAHVDRGIPCQYCHSTASRLRSAGLPTEGKCQGCHNNMDASTPLLKQWADVAGKAEPVVWTPVAIMPDFVYFSHRPHLSAGLACETCHGEVGKMQAAEPKHSQNMGWCLTCHQGQGSQRFVKLSDCATCHQ